MLGEETKMEVGRVGLVEEASHSGPPSSPSSCRRLHFGASDTPGTRLPCIFENAFNASCCSQIFFMASLLGLRCPLNGNLIPMREALPNDVLCVRMRVRF
jgi:hypothetical protein